jgi:ABC-type dipeptide/oligopeptide/nickel transport system permease subunit
VSASASSPASSLQASSAFASAGAAAPDEFYDLYTNHLEAEGQWARARRRFMRHRLAVASLLIVTLAFAAGFLASRLAPYGYEEVNIHALSSGPSWSHPFGTDQIGRDYFSRTLYGLRTEAEIALVIGIFGTLIGTLIGAVSGYLGGLVDMIGMRFADLLMTVPPLVTILVAATFLHTDTLFKVSLLIASVLWMPVARVVRSTTLTLREQEYVHAARAMGASDTRILRKHILPNAISSVAVAASVMTASAVVFETTLSYLGLGISAYYGGRTSTTRPSVGDVLAAASSEGLFNWWGIVFPGIVVILIVAPIYFIGDGIRDAFDPAPRRYVSARELARRRRGPSRVTRLVRALPRPSVSVRVAMPRSLQAIVDALPRPRRRAERSRVRLLLEAGVVLAVTAAGSLAVDVWAVNPVESRWSLAATDVQNVSQARGAQTQISATADQVHPGVLLAVSNDTLLRTVRVYTSADAGRTWTSAPGPNLGYDACARGEPAAALDAGGRQFVAFTVSGTCSQDDQTPYVVVGVRSGPADKWTLHRLGARRSPDFWDDHPSLAAGPRGRVYVVWSRLLRWTYEGIVVSSSADGGRSWASPRVIDRRLSYPRLATATVGPDATLYVAGADARFGIWVARSRDGGKHFRIVRVARLPGNRTADCATASGHPTPFQGIRCVGPNPTVVATANRVFVTYGVGWPGEAQSVHVGVLDDALHRIWAGPVGRVDAKADRFWPASALDAESGRIWACFYDTSGDPSRKRAWYSCTHSRDGRTWSEPVRAASVWSSPEVLWEDARVYLFGDVTGFGGYTSVAAAGGVVHPMWIDTRDLHGNKQEIFAARVP